MIAYSVCGSQFKGYDGHLNDDSILNSFGTNDCKVFRENLFNKYSPIAGALKAEYLDLCQKESHRLANQQLRKRDEQLHRHKLNFTDSVDEIKGLAQDMSEKCSHIHLKISDESRAYLECKKLTIQYDIQPPLPKNFCNQLSPCLKRLGCETWWKRNLVSKQRLIAESVIRDLQQVHNHKTPYCSTFTLQRRRQQKRSNRDFLESQTAINQNDQEYSLAELSDLSVSNPSILRTELIVRLKGFEAVAKDAGHNGIFITLTTPSRFHRMTKITVNNKVVKVIPNKKYAELSPRDAQNYLTQLWGKIQAKLGRENIKPYGFRVAEPHHDGTPHWHFMLFIQPKQSDELIKIFQRWALQDTPDEPGADKHRLKVEHIRSGINPKTGKEYSATGYLIKYICKNIDGYGINNSEKAAEKVGCLDQDPIKAAERIEAWARANRIRQFQQIGGPSVTVWRELRRLKEQEHFLEDIRSAAHDSDWAKFIDLMGGPDKKRKDYQGIAKPLYALSEKLDRDSGEIKKVTHTVYGDEAKERVVGLLITGITVLSRTHIWEIKDNPRLQSARQKIMDGIVDVLDEIHLQNTNSFIQPTEDLCDQRQLGALDSYQ